MGTSPAKTVHPSHTDGPETLRPRLGCQLLILTLPFFTYAIWSNVPIGIGTLWGQLSEVALLLFGLAVLAWGVLYLGAQYTTRIRLLDHLVVVSLFSTWWPLKLEPQSLRGFRRQSLTETEKRRLQLLVGALSAVVALGSMVSLGIAVTALIFAPFKLRNPDDPIRYALVGLFLLIETAVHGLAALSVIPTAWRVWQSDGVLLVWRHQSLGCLGWPFGPADLRILARQTELNVIESWLTEHKVPKLPRGSHASTDGSPQSSAA